MIVARPSRLRVAALSCASGALLLGALVPAGPAAAAPGDTSMTIDFSAPGYDPTAPLAPNGQNGWIGGNADLDAALVENDDFSAAGLPAGGRSLRVSNGSATERNRYLQTPEIAAAGEGTPYNTFEGSFTVASATGGAQPGLDVDVNIDAASRYGGVVNLRHTAAGLEVGSYWLPADATDTANASWRSAVFATVPADVPHSIRLVARFLTGQTDTLDIYVDGALVSGGSGLTTWESYHRVAGDAGDKTVNELSFRNSVSAPSATGVGYDNIGASAPSVLNNGLLFSDISFSVAETAPPVPTDPPATLPAAPDPEPDVALSPAETAPGETLTFTLEGFLPYENVYATWYSTPQFGGWFQADAAGTVVATLAVPDLDPGEHTLQFTGAASGRTAAAPVTLAVLVGTGSEPWQLALVGSAALLLGSLAVVLRRRTRRT